MSTDEPTITVTFTRLEAYIVTLILLQAMQEDTAMVASIRAVATSAAQKFVEQGVKIGDE